MSNAYSMSNEGLGPGARLATFVYGLTCYVLFLGTFLYAIGFVGNLWPALGLHHPFFRGMDYGGPATGSFGQALLIDALLLGLFAIQHSGMARASFKSRWTRIVPPAAERSTFVLATCICLAVLFWQWRPLGTRMMWDLSQTPWAAVMVGLSAVGWLTVLVSTFMINHFDLFGLRQVWYALLGRSYPGQAFATPGLYRAVRHPIYLGFIIAFWATPTMTAGHLLFAVATTGYILVAIQLEERDLIRQHGDAYRSYRRRVSMLAPWPKSRPQV
jgi:protein-S-isoprenylcysteine O-methyltransferase Ste14